MADVPEDDAPPPYSDTLGTITSDDAGLSSKASMGDDGRVNIRIDQSTRQLSSLLVPALRSQLELVDRTEIPPAYIPPSLGGEPGQPPPPPLNVVIHVVGSRGDVQPFVALGKVLKERYGHRVRLATHPVFKDFVNDAGLEHFNIGGDPSQLMAFMVKNPGLMPGFDTIRSGDVGKRRAEISTMIKGCWRSCIEAGDGTGIEASDNTTEDWMSMNTNAEPNLQGVDPAQKPFIADAIIANPPSFAHVHCAEKLGCPLHMMFTMPYSPTQAFPHPLANIQSTNADPNFTNFISYALVDMLTWQGLGDIINRFRQKSLNLDPVSLMWAPGMVARLRIPQTYCWSPSLIPKPKDWGNHISISGFYFLSLATDYTPDPDLKAFLDAGPPPVYIGFGSIVLDDPNAMTKLIFDAVRKTGQRALVSKGWGGFGADQIGIPDSVYMLGNVPHDWLFKHVSCVVHHGGAGTTAAGIACGRPTVVVPFFGDQPFWGAMVAKAGAGPDPIPHKELTADNLADAIMTALKPESLERAKELSESISHEKGSETGAQSFHQFLDLDKMRCTLAPSRAAVWRLKRTDVRLSALAATVLGNAGVLDFKDLKLYRPREYEVDEGPWDPISGGGGALVGTISTMMMGFADFPVAALKAMNIHPDSKKKKPQDQGEQAGESSERTSTSTDSTSPTPTERGARSTNASAESHSSGTSSPAASNASTFNFTDSLARLGSPDLGPQDENAAAKQNKPKGPRGNSFSSVLKEQFNDQMRRRSTSRDTQGKKDPISDSIDTALGTSKGVAKIVGAGFKSPMDFTHGLAKGFHNAPKLYGDKVRKPDQVTDFRSGVMAATKEFGYGFYDGITGLVTQPVEGAKKEGAAGFIKGFGKGIGGMVFKPGAAIFGIPAYTMKGVYKELQQHLGSSVQNYIIAARTAQGYDDWHNSSVGEREDIVKRWDIVQQNLKKKRNPHEQLQDLVIESRRRLQFAEFDRKKSNDGKTPKSLSRNTSATATETPRGLQHATTLPAPQITVTDEETPQSLRHTQTSPPASQEFADPSIEAAIRESVAQTSHGDAEQDALIERAIRASIAELSAGRAANANADDTDEEEGEAIYRAMEASLATAQEHRELYGDGAAAADNGEDEELEKALKASLQERQRKKGTAATRDSDNEWDSPSDPEDEDVRKALAASTEEHERAVAAARAGGNEEELQKALQASEVHAEEMRKKEEEERIVMEYVKKQSLMEEEHRRKAAERKGKQVAKQDGEDEELERAMKLSLARDGQLGEPSK
ncbi:hypothetical protein MBLNU459_g2302t2 [Dothideomycetes sp. NU459]